MYDLRCSECGKFVSYRDPDVMAYTPYGTQYDTEPPDPVYICGPCWDGLTDEDKALIERVAWMGPGRAFGGYVSDDSGTPLMEGVEA